MNLNQGNQKLYNRITRLLILFLITLLSIGCEGDTQQNKPEKEKQYTKSSSEVTAESHIQNMEVFYDAALTGNIEIVKSMLEQGVDVNGKDLEGTTALMLSSYNGHTNIVKLLLDNGAHIEARSKVGRTALMFVSTGPFPETVTLLLENDASVNAVDHDEHFTPLMHAAAEGLLEIVKILLEYGADPSLRDIDGDTAASFALQNGHKDVVNLLKKY